MQNDYIDFKFGDHWASEFNLLAVSSSDRYTPPVYGSVNPNIATIMGKKGVYKWKTQVNEKIFNINIAFDSVTIAQLNQIKQWLQPNKIQKLIFSEEPYKYYWAALNAEIDFSHLPFIEGEKQVGERTIIEGVYKGEMVISFVCIDNDGYSTEGTFEGLETENPSSTIKGNDFVLTDADNDYIEDLKIEGKSEQETKYNNTLSDTDFADVNSRSVEKAWKTNNLAQIQAKNGEVTISAPYQYSGIAQEQREALIDHKYFASAEINTDSLDTALEIAGKNITNSIEGKDINITDGLVGPVDDLIVSGDASQDKLYNNEINSSFLEDLDNWDNQNNGKATISKQKATVTANEKYDGISQYTEENNVGDKYYVRAKVQSNNIETALEVETEKGSAEGSSITINDASDNKLENIRIEGKHSQEHYDQKDLGEGEIISYNNADNCQRYTKVSISGNSAQEVVEEVPGTEVEGESITAQDITLPKGRIGVYGNSKQESRSGKNKFNIEKLTGTNITDKDSKTGAFKMSNCWGIIVMDNASLQEILKPNTQYKCIADVTLLSKPDDLNASNSSQILSLYNNQDVVVVNMLFTSNKQEKDNWEVNTKKHLSTTFTTPADLTGFSMIGYNYRTERATNEGSFKFENIMILEATEEDESFEQYGATPSPDYPSKVVCLGSNKNLLHMQEKSYTQLGVNVTQKESCLKLDGTTNGAQNILSGGYVDIGNFKKGKYIFKAHISGSFEKQGHDDFALYIRKKNDTSKSYGSITGTNIEEGTNSFIFELTEDTDLVIQIWVNASGIVFSNFEMKLKVEEGTEVTSYSPYGQGSTKISKINKNFYDKENIQLYNNNNSAFEDTTNNNSIRLRTSSFKLRTGSYILSGVPSGISLIAVRTYDMNKTVVTGGAVRNGNKFTLQEGIEYIHLLFSKNDGSNITADEIANANLMIEKGNVATDYIEHQQTDYLLYIQQEMLSEDYFVKEADGWKEVHGWDVYEITGNENWRKHTTTSNNAFYFEGYAILANAETPANNKEEATIINTHYKNYAVDTIAFNNIVGTGLAVNKAYYIGTGLDGISTLEEFKAKLQELYNAGTPVKFYYKLKTPTKLACTKEQIEVYEQIAETELFLDTTNIYSNDEIAPNFKLEYNYVLPSPSPEVPSEIQNIRDSIKIKLSNQDGSKTKQINFPLSEGQKLMKGDYLARDGIHHVRKQIELDGTENWRQYNSRLYLYIEDAINAISSVEVPRIKSNMFVAEAFNSIFNNPDNAITDNQIGTVDKHKGISFYSNKHFTDVTSLKSWLAQQKQAGTPIIVEYELATEEIEPYTPEQQEAYNNLTHLIMYNGQNTLSSQNELKPQLKWEIPESPSPDYPSEIETLKDSVKVTACSANELDLTKLTITEKPNIEIDNISANEVMFHAINNTARSYYLRFKTTLKEGTYYLRKLYEMLEGTAVSGNDGSGVMFISKSDWSKELVRLYANSERGSFTLTEDTEVFITLMLAKSENGKIRFYNLILSKDDVDFVKHEQNSVTVPIQKEMLEEDYIDLKTNMEAHTWNYIELDETANWNKEGELENVIRVAVSTGKTSDSYEGKCTHFNFIGNYNLDEEHVYVTYTGLLYVFINKEIASTAEEFKTWLVEQKEKGTPVRVYWKADKTSGTVLTSEQKTELQKLRSYREITNIISNDVLQPNIKIEYIKKPSYTTKLTGNTEQLLSLIYQTNIDKTKILLDNISDNDNSFTFTHPILINLTKQFGSGKEPTKEWLDTNIDFWDVAEGGAPSVETSSRVKTVGSNINLFDPDNHIELDGQYRHYSEGEIVGSANFFGIKIPVLGNMVYSVNSNFSRNGYSNLCYYDKDFTFMWGEPFTEGQTFRTPFNCRYITLALNKNYDWFTLTYGEIPIQKVDCNLANIDMQISGYDNQFKSFPLAKGQELLQLPNGTQDTLEADGIHKRVEKIIINGTENWLKQNGVNHEKTWRFIFSRTNGSLSSAKNNCYCDKFINYSADDLWNEDIEGIAVSKSQVIIRINSEKAESVVELKQLLQDNNLVLYLPKVPEEIIPYSNAQKAWYDEFEIYRKNTKITTIAETKPWYSFTYDINDTYSVNSTKVNEYEKLGLIFNNLEDRPRFIVNRTADGSGTIKMRKPLVVDLTNAFGAGKEPDLAWCLENITFDNSCEYGTPSPNVPSELISVGSNPIRIENKSRNLIKEQNLLNWTKEYCTAERLTEKYDNRNIYRISFENHKKGTISTRIQQKKGNMVFSIYARVIQADNPTVNRLVVAKVTSDSSSSTPVSYKSLENLIGEWQKIYIPITAESISDAAELVLEVQHNADTDDSTIIDLCMPQLEEGFTPHDYIPYAPEKINNLTFTTPLRQLKNGVRDEFSKDGIIRRIGEHTIKSSDEVYWIVFNQDKSYVTICGQLGIYVRGDNSWDAPSFYCNRIEDCTSLYRIAQAKSPAPSRTKEGIGIIDSEYRMCLRADLMGIVETDTEEDMIRKYKVLLDEKPFTIYYEKEVANIEPLTKLQKNTLANLVTRKQYDHWLISGDLNPEVELSYKLTSSINDIHPWVTGSNLLDKTWFYNDNNIHTKPYVEVDTGDADKSGISATRPIYLLNSGTETANLSLTFDYINIETPLTIQTYSGKFTDDGFVEEAKVSEITIEPFTNYQPFKDIYDNNPANWKIEIDSTLGEVYLRHNTDETKVLNLNRFNKDHTFLSLADCNFVDYDKVFPTIISEIEGTAIENTIFNKVIIANTADNYRLKNVNVEWKHTYL